MLLSNYSPKVVYASSVILIYVGNTSARTSLKPNPEVRPQKNVPVQLLLTLKFRKRVYKQKGRP
jgi:hypothetical protein